MPLYCRYFRLPHTSTTAGPLYFWGYHSTKPGCCSHIIHARSRVSATLYCGVPVQCGAYRLSRLCRTEYQVLDYPATARDQGYGGGGGYSVFHLWAWATRTSGFVPHRKITTRKAPQVTPPIVVSISGSHFRAAMVIWQGIELTRNHEGTRVCTRVQTHHEGSGMLYPGTNPEHTPYQRRRRNPQSIHLGTPRGADRALPPLSTRPIPSLSFPSRCKEIHRHDPFQFLPVHNNSPFPTPPPSSLSY